MLNTPPPHLHRPTDHRVARRRKQAIAEACALMKRFGITPEELEASEAAAGVKVTRGPSYTHDPRYQVDPAVQFVGEFTREWQRMRARRA
jgi:hypothetical protein